MLTISGLKRFYYIPGVTDMRCGYSRLLQIVKQMTHHDPYNGDVFVFMSKDRRKVKMVHFENHAYYIHEKVFTDGYSFMLLEYRDANGLKSYRMDWKDLVAVLESPVVKKLRLK
ncbi:MAG: IS66 family insertion sequence element accessory protein TnpB [Prevotella sp.]|nr:IS66 family insertion sequence element accessory protein TnpB [Prevotella sp.]